MECNVFVPLVPFAAVDLGKATTVRRCPAVYPDSKVRVANMGPTWVLSSSGGPHVGPMNPAIGVYTDVPIIRLPSSGNEFSGLIAQKQRSVRVCRFCARCVMTSCFFRCIFQRDQNAHKGVPWYKLPAASGRVLTTLASPGCPRWVVGMGQWWELVLCIISYHRNRHQKGNLTRVCLGTNRHRSGALGWLPFTLYKQQW